MGRVKIHNGLSGFHHFDVISRITWLGDCKVARRKKGGGGGGATKAAMRGSVDDG